MKTNGEGAAGKHWSGRRDLILLNTAVVRGLRPYPGEKGRGTMTRSVMVICHDNLGMLLCDGSDKPCLAGDPELHTS